MEQYICRNRFSNVIGDLKQSQSLSEQLVPTLSRRFSPIWMDRSTNAECMELQEAFGSRIQEETGSPPVERFSGPQIRKFAKSDRALYKKTAAIHLISSFFCSVLCGKSAPVDYGDGAGMNLLNLRSMQWDEEIVEYTAPGLMQRLPAAVASNRIAGGLTVYFEKYGFKSGIPVVVWSGDNPNSLIGAGAGEPGIAVISLGTSDTFFGAMHDFRTDPAGYGHVFGNPAGGFMSLICFSNGSLAREEVRRLCGSTYGEFDRITPVPKEEYLMLPYFVPESTPAVLTSGVKYNFNWAQASADERIRALMESQVLSMRLHSEWQQETFHKIRVTGGASKSPALRQIIADVFQSEVETIAVSNSAGLGAAIRAANAVGGDSMESLADKYCRAKEIIVPNRNTKNRYDTMLQAYRIFEITNTRPISPTYIAKGSSAE